MALSLVSVAAAVASIAVAIISRPELNPVSDGISQYAIGEDVLPGILALLSCAAAAACFASFLLSVMSPDRLRKAAALALYAAGACLLILLFVPAQPGWDYWPPSRIGLIH